MSLTDTSNREAANNLNVTATCEAFHPIEGQDSLTLLSVKVPPLVVSESEKSEVPILIEKKEAFFDICLDTSGSMAGSGIRCAKVAMKRLIDHLINNCGVPANRITVYLYQSSCTARRLGQANDERWIDAISAGGGTSFASVFNEVISNTRNHINEVGRDVDIDTTLFFFTDGQDGDARNLQRAKENLGRLLQDTPRLESTVHTFGFTGDHDAKLLSWLTSVGTNSGCFQYIRESAAIETSMSTTLELLGTSAMVVQRKIEVLLSNDANVQDWVTIKLESDGVSGSAVVRQKPFTENVVMWREYQGSQNGSSSTNVEVYEMQVKWLEEDSFQRIIRMTTFIQHELLRLVESINAIGSSSETADQKRTKLLGIDSETEAYAKTLGTIAFASARMKMKLARESCMTACQRTRSLLQSFLALKADAHKQRGSISNTSLATFNSLAYGQITEAKLKAKLDSRAGKNTAQFADLDVKVAEVVSGLDLDAMEAAESEDTLRELSCAFSTNSYIDALRDGDCLCMTLDVSRSTGAIADPSQLVIKSIFPTFLTSSMFTLALGHSLSSNSPEDVHGGFDRNIDASIAPGVAHESITAVMPLYINKEHWQVAKLRMKPILGYVVTLDATGYTYSQSTTVPFLVLVKALESHPMTEFKQRQIKLILETCDAIYQSSKSLRETTKNMVEQFCASHQYRTVDVITNVYVFLGHVICALRAGDITSAEMSLLISKFEVAAIEEQIRRDMSWKVSEDLMGGIMEWLNIDRKRDIIIPGRVYREQHDVYAKGLENDDSSNGMETVYRSIFDDEREQQGVRSSSGSKSTQSISSVAAIVPSLSISSTASLVKPEFLVPEFDPLVWRLSEASLDRLSMIQNAISPCVDKIRRLLAVIQAPLDSDLPQVLGSRLGGISPTGFSDEFFAKYSPKINLATLLQAYAHTKNSDRRSVQNLMTPFEHEISAGQDSSSDEALQYMRSLYHAKMSQMVNEIVSDVEERFLDSKKDAAASVFTGTTDLKVAAGVLIEAKFRGGAGGRLVTLCATSRMRMPREKIQMLLSGKFKGVKLFADKSDEGEVLRWHPCKRTLYRMFTNYHDKFALDEWRQFHPNRYDDYFACRYVIDGHLSELSKDDQAEVTATYAVSQKLSDAWKQATASATVRAIKVSIINESLEDDGIFNINGTFEQDFNIVYDNLAEKQPAYFLVRFDGTKSSEWIFLCYVPDVAPIRQKMIYAATRASLTKDLGDSHFKDSIYGTNKSDFSLDGYKKHRASLAAPKPLTDRERQLAEIHANEKTMVENMKGGAYRKSHAPGMSFPLTERAVAALKKLTVASPTPVKSATDIPKKFASPASTPLPESPVVTRQNTEASKSTSSETNVDEDEWDDADAKVEKKEEEPTEALAEALAEAEVTETVQEEATTPAAKVERTVNFVKLSIDAENERIDLAGEAKITAKELVKNIDEESPRFTFFAYEHTHNGKAHDSLVFMYTCPSKSKIRERMLYSSCRAGVLQAAKDDAGLEVGKKLETTDVSDLTEDFILDELHPKTQPASGGSSSSSGSGGARGFSKPARPGARRVM
ncbi:hypothetical protein BGX27_006902 [Mortierella sp. AM989]|nr:hypothetical protein BGX27_006902 [Mortierella sp. AM989]